MNKNIIQVRGSEGQTLANFVHEPLEGSRQGSLKVRMATDGTETGPSQAQGKRLSLAGLPDVLVTGSSHSVGLR